MSTMQATLNASGARAEKAAAPSKLRLRKAKSAVLLGLVYTAAALTCALLIGLIVMVLYKPRTWCAFCPMGTMTQSICKLKNKD